MPAYYRRQLAQFVDDDPDAIVGKLTQRAGHDGFTEQKHAQTRAWAEQNSILKSIVRHLIANLANARKWELLLEYPIPRRAKRVDAVLLAEDVILVLEFKTGKGVFELGDQRQVEDYCLDLRDFHAHSEKRIVVPFLVVPEAEGQNAPPEQPGAGLVQSVYLVNRDTAPDQVAAAYQRFHRFDAAPIDASAWDESPYNPTPTIIEAAQALYSGQNVREICRSHAGANNLTKTADSVLDAVVKAKLEKRKLICFVTGVPGSGKTLAGLNIVHNPALQAEEGGLGVFLSGNGPLVKVLSEALARDHAARTGEPIKESRRHVSTFVQNVHQFIRHYVDDRPDQVPPDHVILFDEAQRAWNAEQEYRKWKRKESEPHMMLRVMDRHQDWAVIVALIGGGQEIHDGEAGLPEWGRTIAEDYANWDIYISPELSRGGVSSAGQPLFEVVPDHLCVSENPDLHLAVSVRSYKADSLAAWVNAVIDGEAEKAAEIMQPLTDYPIVLTRCLSDARKWLWARTRGYRRSGLIASSGARRLRGWGLDVTLDLSVGHWFLEPATDVRSSSYLEVPATEFAVQGLELDWAGLCWGADLRYTDHGWSFHRFAGTQWQLVRNGVRQQYLLNKYRVLLTRAREGVVIWVPEGCERDPTRPPDWYDRTAAYLSKCGAHPIQHDPRV